MGEVVLRKFTFFDNFRFLLLKLNPKTSGDLDKTFFQYFSQGIKEIFVKRKSYKFAILVHGKFAGSIAYYLNNGNYELGFFVFPNYRRKGVGTKAIRKISKYLFEDLRIKNVRAVTDIGNVASIKSLKNNNFKLIKRNKKANELVFDKLK